MSDKNIAKLSNLIRAFTFIPNDQNFNPNLSFYAARRHHTELQKDAILNNFTILILFYLNKRSLFDYL
jgi:hypothetical protein